MNEEPNQPQLTIMQRIERIEARQDYFEEHYYTHDHLNGNLVRKV